MQIFVLERLFGGGSESRTVAEVMTAVERYGLVALIGLAMLPCPPRTAVIVCAVAGLSVLLIGAAVAAG